MSSVILEKTVVKEGGKIEISSPELPTGANVEVIVLVREEEEMDETEYLLSTEANREHLEKAMRDAEDPTKHITVDIENL